MQIHGGEIRSGEQVFRFQHNGGVLVDFPEVVLRMSVSAHALALAADMSERGARSQVLLAWCDKVPQGALTNPLARLTQKSKRGACSAGAPFRLLHCSAGALFRLLR